MDKHDIAFEEMLKRISAMGIVPRDHRETQMMKLAFLGGAEHGNKNLGDTLLGRLK